MVLEPWNRLKGLPGGRRIFSKMLSLKIPYTGTLKPLVLEVGPGHSLVEIHERRTLRNHLRSVHAAALMNLCELASGIALVAAIPKGFRGIPVKFNVEYIKKARGKLRAKGFCEKSLSEGEHSTFAEVFDEDGNLVTKAEAKWKIGPSKKA